MTFLKHCKTGLLAFWLAPKNHGKSGLHHEHVAPHEKTERRGMNAFTSVRPRGADAFAKVLTKPKKAFVPITYSTKRETRVMNVRGQLQAPLNPDASRSIVIEGQAQGRLSTEKRNRIVRSLS